MTKHITDQLNAQARAHAQKTVEQTYGHHDVPKISQARFVHMDGRYCPGCESEEVEIVSTQNVDAHIISQEMSCHDCNATYSRNYGLVDFTDFKEGS